MTEREKLLGRVRMYDFALVDAIEYLDGHRKTQRRLPIIVRCVLLLTRRLPSMRTHSAH